jgi:hypothetical protein
MAAVNLMGATRMCADNVRRDPKISVQRSMKKNLTPGMCSCRVPMGNSERDFTIRKTRAIGGRSGADTTTANGRGTAVCYSLLLRVNPKEEVYG